MSIPEIEIEVNPGACMTIQERGIVACEGCPFDYPKSRHYPDICGPGREIKRLIRKGEYPRKGIPLNQQSPPYVTKEKADCGGN